jgi:hypothetical protein
MSVGWADSGGEQNQSGFAPPDARPHSGQAWTAVPNMSVMFIRHLDCARVEVRYAARLKGLSVGRSSCGRIGRDKIGGSSPAREKDAGRSTGTFDALLRWAVLCGEVQE